MYFSVCFLHFFEKLQHIDYILIMNLFLGLLNQISCKRDKMVQINFNKLCLFLSVLFFLNLHVTVKEDKLVKFHIGLLCSVFTYKSKHRI